MKHFLIGVLVGCLFGGIIDHVFGKVILAFFWGS